MNTTTKVLLFGGIGLGLYLATRDSEAAGTPGGTAPGPGPGPWPGLPGGAPPWAPAPIVQSVGKHWCITNKIASNNKAANYGWHFKGATFGGEKFEATVSLPGVRVIQGVGTAHDRAHSDYSQTCILAAQECQYQGVDRRLSDLLVDPEASKLLSVEGPLVITRQPGVTKLDVMLTTPSTGLTRADVAALPDSVAKREPILHSWIEQGLGEYAWGQVTTGDLTFFVFADALQFAGVRVNASATLLQQIADRLDCSLLTPRMADLVFASASKVITPIPLQAGAQMASTQWMLDESDKIAAKLNA